MKRVLLKLSGEALAGDKKTGFDEATCIGVAKQVKTLVDEGYQIAIVTGGGNFWRGRTSDTIDRTKADQIGMLATVKNCIYVSDIFRHVGMKTEIFTPFVCGAFTSLFSKDAALASLEEGKVIFFAGGTGHPYFSTDTGAVLRAIEIEADAMLLAKAIDGIYDSDPKVNPEAKKYDEISIQDVIDQKLAAVDMTASILCMENKMPMLVFGLNEENSPSDSGHTPFGDIFISESKDLEYWGKHRHVMGRGSAWWESVKIGGGAAPIETSEGWLLFYHGVSGTCNGLVYSIGGAILDIDEPSKVKYRCETFLLTPEEWYEERGFVPNVTFPCATIHDAETGRIAVYYGAADSYVGLAFTTVDEVVDYIKDHSVVTTMDTEIGKR